MLFRNTRKQRLTQDERQEGRDAESLWHIIQRQESADGQNAELLELTEISEAVHDVRDDAAEVARLSIEAQASFAATHARLMENIEKDVASRRNTEADAPSLAFNQRFRSAFFRPSSGLRWASVATLLVTTAVGSHTIGYQRALKNLTGTDFATRPPFETMKDVSTRSSSEARVLPVQLLVNDFDRSLRNQAPLDFVANQHENQQTTAKRLRHKLGVTIHLPVKLRSGAKLVGARRQAGGKRPGVQAHYVKDGVRVAVYQMREPDCGLGNLNEVEWNGNLFMTGARGAYRVVAWRAGEDIMTLVSPLAMNEHDSLLLAAAMREPHFA